MIVVGNRPTQDTSQKSQFIIFQVLKNIKKGYIEMTEKFTLRLLRSVLGRSISHCSFLIVVCIITSYYNITIYRPRHFTASFVQKLYISENRSCNENLIEDECASKIWLDLLHQKFAKLKDRNIRSKVAVIFVCILKFTI